MNQPLLNMIGIAKHFAGTQALSGVDFSVRAGEVHALLGQNGAGKSTLIKILAGVYAADQGEISLSGRRVEPSADSLPIAFIHQDLGLFAPMTVAENVAMSLGYPRRRGLISWKKARQAARAALTAIGSRIDPDTPVSELQAAERSIVAIARSLAARADILVLDEPTSTLPVAEVDHLIEALERLREQRIGIIYVTHRLDEVFRIADRVTILRDGRRVATMPIAETSPDDLVLKIIGRKLATVGPSGVKSKRASIVLRVEGAQVDEVGPVTFTVAAGEALGLVGLHGAGHAAIGRAIFGDLHLSGGSISLDGKRLNVDDPREAIAGGIGLVPGKRLEEAAVGEMSVRENLFLNPWLRWQGINWIRPSAERAAAKMRMQRFTIRPQDAELPLLALSGGNQQKVILARWMRDTTRLLILEEPTNGVDVGAKAEIYGLLNEAQSRGMAVIIISSDFEEIERACGRVLVFNRGRLAADLSGRQITSAELTHWAAGGRHGP